MGDILWGTILLRIGLAVGIIWFITLVALLLTLAARVIGQSDLGEEVPPNLPNDKNEQ